MPKYTKYNFDLSRFDVDETYEYVKLPYENLGKQKVLFVLDMVPSEDLKSGKLLSGQTGDLLQNLLEYTKKVHAKQASNFSWLAVSFNAFRTFGKPYEFKAQAEIAFKERVENLIIKYKPDYVVAFGTSVMKALLGDVLTSGKRDCRYSYWLGVPVERTFKVHKEHHTTKVLSTLSLNDAVRCDNAAASLLGYAARNLMPLYGVEFKVDSDRLLASAPILVKDIKQFKKLFDHLESFDGAVCIDTETKNLNKITNRLLTAQFATSLDKSYIIPIYHKDTPFAPEELKYITKRMKAYFEGNNKNKEHVYVNAKFDQTVFKSEIGVEYFANDVVDILGAEFAIDENLKFLDSAIGEWYYSLGNLSVQYGFTRYLEAEFGKENRAGGFENVDIYDESVKKYCGFDVVVPLAIWEQQKTYAKLIGYTKFETTVKWEIGDTIKAFTVMEHTGAGLDVPYLFFLRTDGSPIEQELSKMQDRILNTAEAKKANKLLANKSGMPTTSLFADVQAVTAFNLNKPEHKKTLFFDVLGLKPISKGVSGAGKLDKQFQDYYSDNPVVAAYTALEKAKKLRNAYVKSFINQLSESEDLQKDHRIRPSYGYLPVVTHRTCARNPNLQQVPSRSALGKHIKRLFVARPGTLYIKVDYRVHEVRGWGLISFDKAVAEVFVAAKKIRDAYRLKPSKELAKKLKTEADVHIQNAAYFFNVSMEKVDKALRNAVKGIIFGLIYGMGMKTLANNIKQELDFTEKLVANFSKRFPKAMAWTKNIKKFARENFYVEAPNGIRRHLFGYLIPKSVEDHGMIWSRMDRQAGNAPIQGWASKMMMNGICILDRAIFELKKSRDYKLYITNSVHDSLENEAAYENFIHSLRLIEWSLTTGVREKLKERYGFDLVTDLEIDFEIGACLNTEGWDFSVHQLERLVIDSLLFQRNKLKHKIDPDKVMSIIFSDKVLKNDAPNWMKKQVENLNYKFNLTEKEYIRELLNKGRSLLDDGNKLKEEDSTEDGKKKSKGMIEEGSDLVEYARELNNFRKQYME